VALIIGGPLAWVVFAAALVLLADAIMKYMNGEGSLWDVAWAALGAVPGTRGLTTLAALRNTFRTSGALAAGAHVLGAGRTAVAQLAGAVRMLAGNLRTTLVVLRTNAVLRVRSAPALLRGLRSMAQSDFGVFGTLRNLPGVLRIPLPAEGMQVSRIFGSQLDGNGLPLFKPGKDYAYGSTPTGASWTPSNPRTVGDFRVEAGLPDENPARYVVDGTLIDVSAVREVRLALPLDGNPGGLPEYLIHDAGDAVSITSVGGVNEPWTMQPGQFTPGKR
jgi:hypothetical protein